MEHRFVLLGGWRFCSFPSFRHTPQAISWLVFLYDYVCSGDASVCFIVCQPEPGSLSLLHTVLWFRSTWCSLSLLQHRISISFPFKVSLKLRNLAQFMSSASTEYHGSLGYMLTTKIFRYLWTKAALRTAIRRTCEHCELRPVSFQQ